MTQIPKIIHQTYSSNNLPSHLSRLQSTWQHHHSDWEYRLWTDEDIRNFFSHHYAWFLSIFDDYPHPIMRVDAFRYFLLYHHGGFYADLDSECLSSLNSLTSSKRDILLAQESEVHIQRTKARKRGLSYIVSNAFMASIPSHPFWLHVIDLLKQHKDAWDLLDATGPFMLTKAYASYSPKLPLLASHYFCSLADSRHGSGLQKQHADTPSDKVYAIHHWFGSWWKQNALRSFIKRIIKTLMNSLASQLLPNYKIRKYISNRMSHSTKPRVITYSKGKIVQDELVALDDFINKDPLPLVSALLITKNRKQQALRAIDCFLAQTYQAKELIIIDEGERELEQAIKAMKQPLLRYYRNDNGYPLGRLRNQAIQLAKGKYVCQWDDDDLYHPNKISYQVTICENKNADACFLLRELLLDQHNKAIAISDYRLWEGSILCRKDKISTYPAWRKGEDYWVVHKLAERGTIVALDLPELYLYIYHHSNTWHDRHFAQVWQRATKIYFLDDKRKLAQLANQAYPHLTELIEL